MLAARGKTLLIEGKPAPTPEAARSFLTGEMAAARQRLLPQLTRLGILG